MKLQFSCLFLVLLLILSCQDNKEQRLIETAKDAKKQEIIFDNINKA